MTKTSIGFQSEIVQGSVNVFLNIEAVTGRHRLNRISRPDDTAITALLKAGDVKDALELMCEHYPDAEALLGSFNKARSMFLSNEIGDEEFLKIQSKTLKAAQEMMER